MSILDRVKERIETDLSDSEIQMIIDEANQDVVSRFGPHANPANPITVRQEGHRKKLVLLRPIDTDQAITVKEYYTAYGWGETNVTLSPTDYRVWPSGLIVERLITGPNSWSHWADEVELTYVPQNDGDQREEVIIKLVMLAVRYDTTESSTIGDVYANNPDYQDQRDKIFASLMPRGGMLVL